MIESDQRNGKCLALALVSTSLLIMALRMYGWKRATRKKGYEIFKAGRPSQHDREAHALNNTKLFLTKRMRALPLLIQEYLMNVLFIIDDDDTGADYMLHKPISVVESLRLEQEGTFFVCGRWLPFQATQYISTSLANPGFLWEAQVSIFPDLPIMRNVKIYIRDHYSNGKGGVEVDLMGIIPLVRTKNVSGMNSAGLMKWLSEIVLHPSSFLPHGGNFLHWKLDAGPLEGSWPTKDEPRIRSRIIDQNGEEETEVEFYFDNKGLISSVRGVRFMKQSDPSHLAPWECRFADYKLVDGMMIPLSVEAGWWNDEGNKFDVYVKARNLQFDYKFY